MIQWIRRWLSESSESAPRDPVFKIVIGLGNVGRRYRNTRHNVGFMVVDALAREAGSRAWSSACRASVCYLKIEELTTLLAKPLTYVNRSGEAAQLLMQEHRLMPRDLLVILDDMSLPLGRIRIREKGSAGGHRGLESICQALGSEEVLRLRLGIGEELMPENKAEFVLSNFAPDRQQALDEMIGKAGDAIKMILREGATKAMAVYNA
jgi:peptidyl-tRNA hydrolase, PTH1 family